MQIIHVKGTFQKNKMVRSQIYIKLTRSNDDDDERKKHPLQDFCLKCYMYISSVH